MNNIDMGLCGIFLSGTYSGGPGQLHPYPQEHGSHSREDCHVQWVPMWVSFPTAWEKQKDILQLNQCSAIESGKLPPLSLSSFVSGGALLDL